MAPWLRFLEAWMVQQLLRTPAFHRAVERVARGVHRLRHGPPADEMGGTRLDAPRGNGSFLRHFAEEVQTQLGRAEGRSGTGRMVKGGRDGKEGVVGGGRGGGGRREMGQETTTTTTTTTRTQTEGAEAAWKDRQQQQQREGGAGPPRGFMGEYVDALREQMRGGK